MIKLCSKFFLVMFLLTLMCGGARVEGANAYFQSTKLKFLHGSGWSEGTYGSTTANMLQATGKLKIPSVNGSVGYKESPSQPYICVDDQITALVNKVNRVFVGAVMAFGNQAGVSPTTYVWRLCDGTTMSDIANYPTLNTRMGTTWGGTGVVPNLQGKYIRGYSSTHNIGASETYLTAAPVSGQYTGSANISTDSSHSHHYMDIFQGYGSGDDRNSGTNTYGHNFADNVSWENDSGSTYGFIDVTLSSQYNSTIISSTSQDKDNNGADRIGMSSSVVTSNTSPHQHTFSFTIPDTQAGSLLFTRPKSVGVNYYLFAGVTTGNLGIP